MILRLVIAWVVTQPVSRLSRRVIYSSSLALLLVAAGSAQAAETEQITQPMHLITTAPGPELKLTNSTSAIWQDGVGNGFKAGAHSLTLVSGAGYGVRILGSKQSHDMLLASLSYGYMLGPVRGDGHWYKGNWELRGELWGAIQFDPSHEYAVGLTPHLRYDFATGTPLVPYLDIGAGLSATSIREPDLGQTFEFNLQAAGGAHWFVTHNVSVDLELRFLHMSDAGSTVPNLGVNNVSGLLGVSWFF